MKQSKKAHISESARQAMKRADDALSAYTKKYGQPQKADQDQLEAMFRSQYRTSRSGR